MNSGTLNNRQFRTRKDLLQSASRLLKERKRITIEAVAAEARVSRATAYRYFSNVDQLIAEAPVDNAVPEAKTLFHEGDRSGIVERLDKAESILHHSTYESEQQLRVMLAHSLTSKGESELTRQNRRSEYIHEALRPHKRKFKTDAYKNLCAALALVFGTESMIVFSDVLRLNPEKAREVKRWAIKALVDLALRESAAEGYSA